MKVIQGHTDCVRGLCRLPGGSGFASCGNDAYVLVIHVRFYCLREPLVRYEFGPMMDINYKNSMDTQITYTPSQPCPMESFSLLARIGQ